MWHRAREIGLSYTFNAAFCCERCNKIAVNGGAIAPQLHSVPQCVRLQQRSLYVTPRQIPIDFVLSDMATREYGDFVRDNLVDQRIRKAVQQRAAPARRH